MIEPSRVPGDHKLFICGNDAKAKKEVAGYLNEWFGNDDVTLDAIVPGRDRPSALQLSHCFGPLILQGTT